MKKLLSDRNLRTLLSSGAATICIKIGSAVLSYAMLLALAKHMAPGEFGRFGFGLSLAIVGGTLSGLGLATAVLRFLPQYRQSGDKRLARGFVAAGLAATLCGSCLLTALVVAAIWVFGFSGAGYVPWAACLIPLLAVAEFLANAMRAEGSTIAALAPRDILWRAAVILAVFILSRRGFGFDGASALMLCAAVLAAILVLQGAHAAKLFRADFGGVRMATDIPLWIKVSGPMWGAAALYALVQQFDVVILGLFMSPEQAGPYFAALRTASMLNLLLIAGNMASAPMIAKHYHAGDIPGLHKLMNLLTPGVALPTIAGYALLALIGKWLLGLFDPSFAQAYPLLLILGAGFTFDAIAGPTGYILQMVGKEKAYLAIMASAYGLTLALQCLLIPRFGVYGAAVPSALGIVFANILIIAAVRRATGIDPSIFGAAARLVAR